MDNSRSASTIGEARSRRRRPTSGPMSSRAADGSHTMPMLDPVTEFLTGIRINRNGHRDHASQIQVGSTFRF
jgi:hypothetical protein